MAKSTKLKQGVLLIAQPFLGDPHFERSVVLLCEHNERGSFGLILNQSSEGSLNEVWDNANEEFKLYVGGPVEQNTLHFIHRLGKEVPETQLILPSLGWGGDYEFLQSQLTQGLLSPQNIRFFVGYTGWGKGQLKRECEENTWIVAQFEANFLFDTPAEDLWRATLKQMGGEHSLLANYPIDPRLN